MIKKFSKTQLLHRNNSDILFLCIESKAYYFSIVLFILFCLSLFIFSRELPGGLRILTVKSNSMNPTIAQGDLMFVQSMSSGYMKGDIVSFYALANNPSSAFAKASADKEEIVTHRIYAVSGNVYFTKGDHNEAADEQNLKPRLIIGRVIVVIRNVGYLAVFLKSVFGQIICVILPGAIIIGLEIFRLFVYFQQKRFQGHTSEIKQT